LCERSVRASPGRILVGHDILSDPAARGRDAAGNDEPVAIHISKVENGWHALRYSEGRENVATPILRHLALLTPFGVPQGVPPTALGSEPPPRGNQLRARSCPIRAFSSRPRLWHLGSLGGLFPIEAQQSACLDQLPLLAGAPFGAQLIVGRVRREDL